MSAQLFESVGEISRTAIDPAVTGVMALGVAVAGDSSPVAFSRVAVQPSHPFFVRSSEGAFWQGAGSPGLDVRWFGAKCDGITDDRNAVLAATAAARAIGSNLVKFPAAGLVLSGGGYDISGVVWEGVDPNRTVLKFVTPKATAPVKVLLNGNGGMTGGGIRRLCLWADAAAGNAGTGLLVQGGPVFQPDESIFEDFKITGAGTWDYPMFLSGSARTPATSGTLVGLRKVAIRNGFFGRANVWGLYAECVEDLTLQECGVFGGTTGNGNGILINGNSTVMSQVVHVMGCNIQGICWMYYTRGAVVCSYTGGTIFSTGTVNCWSGGDVEGSFASAGTNNLNYAA